MEESDEYCLKKALPAQGLKQNSILSGRWACSITWISAIGFGPTFSFPPLRVGKEKLDQKKVLRGMRIWHAD